MTQPNFTDEVHQIVGRVPYGRVITYGTIAYVCGRPRAARIVGGIAHYGNPNLPWHRVVKAGGKLAEGYPGGVSAHQAALEREGIDFVGETIANFENVHWSGS